MGTIRLAWWNLENLFDTDDDPISADLDFTVAQGWTPEAFAAKKANLAAVLRQLTADGPPELLGVAEVEGDDVFAELLDEVGEPNLQMVRDPRHRGPARHRRVAGLRPAQADRGRAALASGEPALPTRDIFEVVFTVNDTGERLVVLASHWPSRRRGRYDSEPSRIALAENLAFLVRNHVRVDAATYLRLCAAGDLDAVRQRWETPVLLMGDFNDEPPDRALVSHLLASSERDRVAGPDQRHRPVRGRAGRLHRRRHLPVQPDVVVPAARQLRHLLPGQHRQRGVRQQRSARSYRPRSSST